MEKRELVLEGLNCANCAAAIEAGVKELDGIIEASVNFSTATLRIQISNKARFADILNQTKDIVKKHEPHIVIHEKSAAHQAEQAMQISNKQNQANQSTLINTFNNLNIRKFSQIILSAILLATALIFEFSNRVEIVLYLSSYLLAGYPVLLKAVKNIIRGRFFDENFLMTVATTGALAIHEFAEGVAVMLFYQIGELFQDMAVNKSRKSISALMNIRPDSANLKTSSGIITVSPQAVSPGDIILVKPGEKVPLDGTVISGYSTVDTSALTGESIPREITEGDEVLSGFINKNGLVTLKVTRAFSQSTVSKILELVENASSKKAPTENFITKFAGYYTPAVVFAAAVLAVIPPLLIPGAAFSEWLYRALVFLVISCPCALVISIPLGFFAGIGAASRNGILVKGSNYLEALNNINTIVFDKTGTLTKGIFKVSKIINEDWISKEKLLKFAALAESHSSHPAATAILHAYGKEPDKNEISTYEEIAGYGISTAVNHRKILVGSRKLMEKDNIPYKHVETTGTTVHIAIDKKYAGFIVIEDEVKADAREVPENLKKLGVKKIIMLTGDNKSAGIKTAKLLGLDEVYAELLPHEKVAKVELINKQKTFMGNLIFVGDGINDAPVLARADVGVAMGGLGSDAAIEAADVVLMTDEPSKLVQAIKIARKTRRIVMQNIIFALGIKAVVLLLGAAGIASMWSAVFADVGVTVIAVLNSIRALKI